MSLLELPADLPDRLRESLARPVEPRFRAAWAPGLCYGRHFAPAPPDARPAAVLALLVRDGSRWRLPLTLRPEGMLHHAGQICLPGGSCEPHESVEQSARRELSEELGQPSAPVHVLGRLSPVYVFNSGFLVTPCVAWTPRIWRLRPNQDEVAEVLLPDVGAICAARPAGRLPIQRGGVHFTAPFLEVDGGKVWGATSIVLGELFGHLLRIAGQSSAGGPGAGEHARGTSSILPS